MTTTDTPLGLICQVNDPDVYLPCKELVDEFRCEQIGPHEAHQVGEHTIRHRIAGAQYSCTEVEASMGKKSSKSGEPLSPSRMALLAVGGVVLSLVLALAYQFALVPLLDKTASFSAAGDIEPVNTKLATFTGQEVANANAAQKALGTGKDNATTPPAFIFSNGEESEKREKLDLYVDFGDKESRDLLLLNQSTLKAMVESGRVDLYIHAVPSGSAYSMYAAETLAETFYLSPEKAWPTMLEVLKFADEADREDYSLRKLAKGLASVAEENKVSGIDEDSIQNGTFASWLLSISSDEKLALGTKLPSMYLADSSIELATVDLAKNSEFNRALE